MEELTKDEVWEIAKNLNKIDGLDASDYLENLIEENKKGKITKEEIISKLKEYYQNEERNNW